MYEAPCEGAKPLVVSLAHLNPWYLDQSSSAGSTGDSKIVAASAVIDECANASEVISRAVR